MKRLITPIFILLIMFGITSAQAAAGNGLYQAQVPVPSQSKADWQRAMPQALTQVLVKVSGNENIVQAPHIKQQLVNAAALVQSYSYLNNTNANGQSVILLQVQFNEQAVNQLLHQLGTSSWGNNRPLVLIWLATPDTKGQTLLSSTSSAPAVAALQKAANRRGLPILLPIMDLEDQQQVTLTDVEQSIPGGALQSAKRYGANAVLEGNVTNVNGQWSGQWQLLLPTNNNLTWNTQGSNMNQVLTTAINKVADNMASQFTAQADSNQQNQQITIRVTSVNGLDDVTNVLKYLRSLPPVTSAEVMGINTNDVLVNITITGGLDALNAAIGAGTELQPQAPAAAPASTTATMTANGGAATSAASASAANEPPSYQWMVADATNASVSSQNPANDNSATTNPESAAGSDATPATNNANQGIDMSGS